jgi:hypothetical protein
MMSFSLLNNRAVSTINAAVHPIKESAETTCGENRRGQPFSCDQLDSRHWIQQQGFQRSAFALARCGVGRDLQCRDERREQHHHRKPEPAST